MPTAQAHASAIRAAVRSRSTSRVSSPIQSTSNTPPVSPERHSWPRVPDDVHGRLLRRGARAVDAGVPGVQLVVGVLGAAVVRVDQPAGPFVAHLVVEQLAVAVGAVAEAVAVVRGAVGQLAGEPPGEALAG